MRLKRKYVALIVVIMLIVTSLLAMLMVQYTQGGRIAYVAVRTDKSTYADGENVTFKFVQLTPGLSFSASGMGIGYLLGDNSYSVQIIKIPDGYDPDQVISQKNLDRILSWNQGNMGIRFDFFNSTDATLSLSWNGTVIHRTYNQTAMRDDIYYLKATGGYYLVYPHFMNVAGHTVKFLLDRSAIFFIDTIDVRATQNQVGTAFTLDMNVSAPDSLVGTSHCQMSWSLSGVNQVNGSQALGYASFDLSPGSSHHMTISGEVYPYDYNRIGLTGWLQTSWGNYSFSIVKFWNDGRWTDGYGYYY